jgi:Ulp1 family protease
VLLFPTNFYYHGKGYDCGVFTCMFCDFIANEKPVQLIHQDDMSYYRQRIALSILQGNAILD